MTKRILIVEDDDTLRGVLEREIAAFGYQTHAHPSAESALAFARDQAVDVGLFDLRLPGMSGLELLEAVHAFAPGLPVVFLTGHGSLPDAVQVMRAGAYDFLIKPAPLDELERTLQRAIEYGHLRRQNRLLRTLVDREATSEILGESAVMHELRESIARIGASEANVLVSGENGTGKELVARAIHGASPRGGSTFVVVNCGAIPAELFESELFGHRRGAFTGADRKRLGLIELAEGGTLFLDEIGELPLALQPALLRAVQFGEYRPVGAERTETADVRVLAATNRDLTEAIALNEFREDLYHRISTLTVAVPPLRERHGDVQLLAQRFLDRHNATSTATPRRFTDEALAGLAAQDWSGNVRELENVVVRLVTLVDGDSIGGADVDRHVRRAGAQPSTKPMPRSRPWISRRSNAVRSSRRSGGMQATANARPPSSEWPPRRSTTRSASTSSRPPSGAAERPDSGFRPERSRALRSLRCPAGAACPPGPMRARCGPTRNARRGVYAAARTP